MAKNVKLLLTENVDSVGIVGDVVNVRTGYARNFLLPRNMATTPSDEAIAAVAVKRAEAVRQVAELRKEREALIHKMAGAHITLIRSCNELGHLYASVTQQEIATALAAAGFPGVKPRDVRLNQSIKRVDNYDVHIKFEADLDETIKLTVNPDRKLEVDHREEDARASAETAGATAQGAAPAAAPEAPESGEAKARKDKGDKGEKGDKSEAKAKPEKSEKGGDQKPEKKAKKEGKGGGGKDKDSAEGAPAEKKASTGGGWGTPVSKPEDFDLPMARRGKRR
jgi:large subunit ribosomal protein L9